MLDDDDDDGADSQASHIEGAATSGCEVGEGSEQQVSVQLDLKPRATAAAAATA